MSIFQWKITEDNTFSNICSNHQLEITYKIGKWQKVELTVAQKLQQKICTVQLSFNKLDKLCLTSLVCQHFQVIF